MNTKGKLYRDPKHGKIAGVCAGIAEYFNLETWVVRILTVTAFFLLAGPFVIVSYIAAWFILEKRPSHVAYASADTSAQSGNASTFSKVWRDDSNNDRKIEVKQSVYTAGEPPRQAFFDIQQRFRKAESRLRKLEGYVTSKEFQINREISRL